MLDPDMKAQPISMDGTDMYQTAVSLGFVPPTAWGEDHFSTLLYIESRVVNHSGAFNEYHPSMRLDGRRYPSRLVGHLEMPDHSDRDCVQDFIMFEYATWTDEEVINLTEKGWALVWQLRKHKSIGPLRSYKGKV